jgi:hypothetical protein
MAWQSYQVAAVSLGSFMNAEKGISMPADVCLGYAGTVGSVVVLIRR